MSIKSLDSEVIDKLYKKYGFLDDEGYLVGTSDPKFLAVQKRIDQLARKTKKLTAQEEREAAELVIIQKAYMKELRDYVLDQGIEEDGVFDGMESDGEDGDFEPSSEPSSSEELSCTSESA